MKSFEPIDHKDSSEEYRAEVWNGVATEIIGDPLLPIVEPKEVISIWQFLNAKNGSVTYFQEFQLSGIVKRILKSGHVSEWQFSVAPGSLMINDVKYHCALTASGKLVVFNGDASLCLVGHRCSEINWGERCAGDHR